MLYNPVFLQKLNFTAKIIELRIFYNHGRNFRFNNILGVVTTKIHSMSTLSNSPSIYITPYDNPWQTRHLKIFLQTVEYVKCVMIKFSLFTTPNITIKFTHFKINQFKSSVRLLNFYTYVNYVRSQFLLALVKKSMLGIQKLAKHHQGSLSQTAQSSQYFTVYSVLHLYHCSNKIYVSNDLILYNSLGQLEQEIQCIQCTVLNIYDTLYSDEHII